MRVGTTPRFVATAEAARRLKVSPMTIRRWVHAGRLDGQRVGRSLIVEEPAVAKAEDKQMEARHVAQP